MGWFTCYGRSRHEEKKSSHGPAMLTDSESNAPLSKTPSAQTPSAQAPAQKLEPDNLKSTPTHMDGTKVPPKEGHANGSMESSPVELSPVPSIHAHTFTFSELAEATNNFQPECSIGEGGFGCVYKGTLENGQVVAIKQLDRKGLQGNREFLVEVLMLSLLHHENLVNLVGYCADGDQRLLVYEYMPLGSLEDHLHDLPPSKDPLDWTTRMKIAAGAAKGLEYLHDIADPPVIYRDLKCSNILLGEGFYPKLSDFGLAKLGPVGDKTHVSTRVMGTYGYCAPEYAMTGQLTLKSDVYSFGVVLLELITGRKAIDQSKPSGEHNLVAWARPLFKDRRKFSQMADPILKGCYPVRGLFQALAVAAMCLHEQAAARPVIADVVTALNFLASQEYEPEVNNASAEAAAATEKNQVEDHIVHHHQQPSLPHQEPPVCAKVLSSEGADVGGIAGVDSPKDAGRSNAGWRASCMEGKKREQAVAEARMWGQTWRERRGGAHQENVTLQKP